MCVVRQRFLRWADHSFRRVLSVVCLSWGLHELSSMWARVMVETLTVTLVELMHESAVIVATVVLFVAYK